MQNKEEIKEEGPVTTTANAGQSLVTPELPIKLGVFKRYKEMKKKRIEQNQNRDRHDSDFL